MMKPPPYTTATVRQIRRWLCALLCVALAHPAWAWWDCRWQNRVRLQFTTPLTANAENEIVLNTLPDYTWNNPSIDNSVRLVTTDDLTPIPFYMEPRSPSLATPRMHLWLKPTTAISQAYLYFNYAPTGTTVDNAAIASATDLNIFSNTGIRYWTRSAIFSSMTGNLATYWSRFDGASDTTGYGCVLKNDFNLVSNQKSFTNGYSTNIVYNTVFVLNVPNTQAGIWEMRAGGDFGWGGGFYVDGQAIDEQWSTDLWWGNSYGIVNQVLENYGATNTVAYTPIFLAAGKHFFRLYGVEPGNDGAAQIQLRSPNGIWTTLSTTAFSLTAPQCSTLKPLLTPPDVPTEPVSMRVSKTVALLEDPINGATNPRYIPGARARYTIMVEKTSKTSPDLPLTLQDNIPANATLVTTSPIGDVTPATAARPLAATPPASTTGRTPAGPVMWWPDNSGLTLLATDMVYANATAGPFTAPLTSSVRAIQIRPKSTSSPSNSYSCGSTTRPARFFAEFDVLVNN